MKTLTTFVNKKFVFSAIALVALFTLIGLETANAAYVHTTTLRFGVRSTQVLSLQQTLNASGFLVATGVNAGAPGFETTYFGPRTLAAVRAFQASRGLVVDGIVGPRTGAALMLVVGVPVNVPLCPNGNTVASNCTVAPSGTPAPVLCPNGNTLASNCTQPPGSTPTPPSGGLSGGAGSINVTRTNTFSSEEVGEGEDEAGVLSFDVESEDSDVRLTSVRLEFHQGTAADSEDMSDYLESVQIFLNGDQVGEKDIDDFSEDNDIFSTNISLDSDAIIRENDEKEVTVRVTVNNSIDSADRDTAVFNVGVSSIRFQDGSGVTSTDSFTLDIDDDTVDDTLEASFTIGTFASASDTELRITAGADADEVNEAHVIEIHETDETNNVSILSFNMEVRGDSDITVDSLPVSFTVTGQDNVDEMISGITLWMDGDEVGEVSMTSDCVEAGGSCVDVGAQETYFFDDLDLDLEAGEEYEFLVKIDIYGDTDAPGDVAPGDTIFAVFGETQTDLSQFDAEDEAGDELADGDKTGTVTGEASEVRVVGLNLDLVSATAVKSAGDASATQSDSGLFTITFDATAFGGDIWVDRTEPDLTGGTTESDLDMTGTGTIACTITSSTGATLGTNAFQVEEDDTERFAITCDVRDGATDLVDGFFDVSLEILLYALTDADGDLQYTFNLDDFKTPQVFLDDNGA